MERERERERERSKVERDGHRGNEKGPLYTAYITYIVSATAFIE